MCVILIGLFAAWFVISGIPTYVASVLVNFGIRKSYRLKPFDCEKCLGFWLGLMPEWSIIDAGISSLIAIVTVIIINRLR